MKCYKVRIPVVEVYEVEVEADSPADALDKVQDCDYDFPDEAERLDSYWLDLDEEMDVTEIEK